MNIGPQGGDNANAVYTNTADSSIQVTPSQPDFVFGFPARSWLARKRVWRLREWCVNDKHHWVDETMEPAKRVLEPVGRGLDLDWLRERHAVRQYYGQFQQQRHRARCRLPEVHGD